MAIEAFVDIINHHSESAFKTEQTKL